MQNKVTFRCNDEVVKQLEDLAARKYPRAEDRATMLRWLINDAWEELEKGERNGKDSDDSFRSDRE